MTTPLWALLGFAVWTLVVLMAAVGVRRWTLILTGRAQLTDFPADAPHGSTAYRRAVRAHLNCVENLPVFAAIVLIAAVTHVTTPTMDALAIAFVAARVSQTLVHVSVNETNATVLVRFGFFLIQIVAMFLMALEVVRHAPA